MQNGVSSFLWATDMNTVMYALQCKVGLCPAFLWVIFFIGMTWCYDITSQIYVGMLWASWWESIWLVKNQSCAIPSKMVRHIVAKMLVIIIYILLTLPQIILDFDSVWIRPAHNNIIGHPVILYRGRLVYTCKRSLCLCVEWRVFLNIIASKRDEKWK